MQLQFRKSDAMSPQLLCIKYNWSDTKKILPRWVSSGFGWLQMKITADKSASFNIFTSPRKLGRDKTANILLIKLIKNFDLTLEKYYWTLGETFQSLKT